MTEKKFQVLIANAEGEVLVNYTVIRDHRDMHGLWTVLLDDELMDPIDEVIINDLDTFEDDAQNEPTPVEEVLAGTDNLDKLLASGELAKMI